MPRGQKNKPSTRGKRRKARHYSQAPEEVQEAMGATGEDFPDTNSIREMMSQTIQMSTLLAELFSCTLSDDDLSDISDDEESAFEMPCYHKLDQEAVTNKADELFQLLLDKYKVKHLTSMEDMLTVVNKEEIDEFPEILRKATKKLANIFAVEMREVDSSRQTYNLISKLKLPNNGRVRAGQGFPKTGLLMTILGFIFINGNRASEESIWRTLRPLRVYPRKKHPVYGEPRKLITQDFVKLKYLVYQQVANSNPPCYEFLWGPQAHAETTKVEALKFLVKITEISPLSFSDFYAEVLKDEQERGNKKKYAAKPRNIAKVNVIPVAVWVPTSNIIIKM